MTDQELQALLARCEALDPSEADLLSLREVLARQEQEEGWAGARASLRQGLEREQDGIEIAAGGIAPRVLQAAEPGTEGGADDRALGAALATVGDALQRLAQRVEVASGVMGAVGLPDWAPAETIAALAEGLRAEAAGADLATLPHEVCAALGIVPGEDLSLSALFDGELAAGDRAAVAARLDADPTARRFVNDLALLGRALRQGLAREVGAAGPVSLWPAVAAELGLTVEPEWAGALAGGILAEAGPIDLADSVMRQVLAGAPAPATVGEERRAPAQPAAVRPAPWYRRLTVLTLVGSAAALLLVLQLVGPEGPLPRPTVEPVEEAAAPAFELAAVNETEIEDLEVAEDAMVQVFQLDEGSPLVIFIDEGAAGDGAQEVTL